MKAKHKAYLQENSLNQSNHLDSQNQRSEQKRFQKQIRVLQLENECLLNVIEQNQLTLSAQKQNPDKVIKSMESTISGYKQVIQKLQEEISHLRQELSETQDTLRSLSQQNQSLTHQAHSLELQKQELELQSSRLVQLMRGRNTPELTGSSSQFKASIVKIRHQYQQSLQATKQLYDLQTTKLEQFLQSSMNALNTRIECLQNQLEKQTNKEVELTIQKPQGSCLEIEYLLQKYYQTQKTLEQQKYVNSQLTIQLSQAQKTLKELSLQGSQLFSITNSFKHPADRENQCLHCQFLKQKLSICQLQRQESEARMKTVVSCYENQLAGKLQELKQKDIQLQSTNKQLPSTHNFEEELEYLRAAVSSLTSLEGPSCILQVQFANKLEQNVSLIKQLYTIRQQKRNLQFDKTQFEKKNKRLSHLLEKAYEEIKNTAKDCDTLRQQNKLLHSFTFRGRSSHESTSQLRGIASRWLMKHFQGQQRSVSKDSFTEYNKCHD